MIKNSKTHWARIYLAMALLAVMGWMTSRSLSAVQEAQQTQSQDQTQTQTKEQPKKKGGFFGGMKSVSGSSSEQTSATSSAGARGIDEGKAIAEKTPSAADMAAVTKMEQYSIPAADLKKFQQDGNLQPK